MSGSEFYQKFSCWQNFQKILSQLKAFRAEKSDRNNGFGSKTPFFAENWKKIAENSDKINWPLKRIFECTCDVKKKE
jgi:hypothetical protein